ncbi:hypothetical protein BD408DRAFT_190827 [Parasitella parasitica]|nr:hypothetical protein BD408DRAFT_190827 [Parasitella parasitica]
MEAFASRENKRDRELWCYLPDPEDAVTVAFQQSLQTKGLYLHPPRQLIPRVIHKLRQE